MTLARIVFAVSLVYLLLGCSDRVSKSKYVTVDENVSMETQSERALRNRFVEYWDARSLHDFDKTYTYEMPYQRFLKPFEVYSGELSVTFSEYNTVLKAIRFENEARDTATVFREYIKDDVILHQKTAWYLVNGTWYRKYAFSLFPQN